jgi:hypothetical protein
MPRTRQSLRNTCQDKQTSHIIPFPSSAAARPTTATALKNIFEITTQTVYAFNSAHYSMVIEHFLTAAIEPHNIHTRMFFKSTITTDEGLLNTKLYDIATTNSYEHLSQNYFRFAGFVTFYLPDTTSNFSIGIQNVGYTGSLAF